jgi:hypothetical protein
LVAETTPMKSSYLTNLVLLAIVLTLLWLSQREQPDSEQTTQLSTLSAQAVNQIRIQRPGKAVISLQQHEQQWTLSEPFSARANQTRVNLLLSLLSAPLHGQFQPMDQSALAQFGLSEPQVVLTMNEQQFAFGGTEPLNQNRYILHEGMVYLIQDDVTPLLTATAGSFVDNRLIEEQHQLRQLELPVEVNSTDTITLSKQEGRWHSDHAGISSDALKALVDSWQHAYAMQVRHLSADALSSLPAPQVSLWFEDASEPLTLILQSNAQNIQLIDTKQQLQYDFPLALQSQLLPQPAQP